jgi:protein-S-isoprenylcysteine O-methyltransferase Ste14
VKIANYFVNLFARWAIVTLSVSLLLFLAAGSMQFSSLRNYIMMFSALLLLTMFSVDPGLAEERSRLANKTTTPGRFAAGLLFLATVALAALDIGRLHWFDSVSAEVRLANLLLFAAATTLQLWAMVANRFFSPEICLQSERGHQLITSGPYRFLRHPGYVAMLISVPASALAIGSCLALAPAIAFCFVVLRRIPVEEEFLERNLTGYCEYMRQVRGRLLPRVALRHRSLRLSVARRFERPGSDPRWL